MLVSLEIAFAFRLGQRNISKFRLSKITIFPPIAQEHWEYWKKNDPNITKRIKKLLADILEHPYTGIGKPEPLKYELAGKWSRRINSEHRLIYSVHNDMIEIYIFSMKYHYSKK